MLTILSVLLATLLWAQNPPQDLRASVDSESPMAIEQVGSFINFNTGMTTNAGTVSTTITVPADAEIVVVGISGYHSVANYFSGGGMTFTKSGVDTAMTAVQPSTRGDGSTSAFMAAMFYLVLPDTGANKTLKYDWSGTSNPTNAPVVSVSFWKGINTSGPVRGSGGGQNGSFPYTTSTITAQSGDLIVAWAGGYGLGHVDTWANVTELTDATSDSSLWRNDSSAGGAWASGSPSGNTTVAASTGVGDDGGIVAISLIPAAAGGGGNPWYQYAQQ